MALPLQILLLHGLKSEKKGFLSVADNEMAFARYDEANFYVNQSWYTPVSRFVSTHQFDAVFVTSTFMDAVTRSKSGGRWLSQYDFLKSSRLFKVAFPQDDYWFSEIRDSFYVDYAFDVVFPVCPQETWLDLLPQFLKSGGAVLQGQTAYVTPAIMALVGREKEWGHRSHDIVYRATRYPKVPNSIGEKKGVLRELFLNALGEYQNVSLDLGGTGSSYFLGDHWYEFLGSSRATLGSSSGSSVLLRNRAMFDVATQMEIENPDLTRAELEEQIFPSADRGKSYTALAPRNLEAAALGVVQLLTPGSYGGFLVRGKDFFELSENCDNAAEAVELLRDPVRSRTYIDSARETLIYSKSLSFQAHRDLVISLIRSRGRNPATNHKVFLSRLASHNKGQKLVAQSFPIAERLWRLARSLKKTFLVFWSRFHSP